MLAQLWVPKVVKPPECGGSTLTRLCKVRVFAPGQFLHQLSLGGCFEMNAFMIDEGRESAPLLCEASPGALHHTGNPQHRRDVDLMWCIQTWTEMIPGMEPLPSW